QQTLNGIKTAINNADSGVVASIVNNGSGERLVLTSKETGQDFGFKIDVADDDGNNTNQSGLSRLAFDPAGVVNAGNNLETLQTSQNALFTINNLAVSKSSNTVSDAVEGVTFTLKKQTTGPVEINVALDSTAVKKTIGDFVTAYNKIRGNLKDQQQKDATLSKETTPSRLERGLRDILRQTVSSYGLSVNDIGMQFDRTGVLSFDQSKLDTALVNDPKTLEKLFANTGTTTDARVSFLGGASSTLNGTYAISITQAAGGGNTVAGTFGGVAGTGVDNVLTGAAGTYAVDGSGNPTSAEGLQLAVLEGESGALGTVTFSRGLASALSAWIDTLNEEGGMLDSRTGGLNSKLQRLEKDEERFNLRLDQIEKRYRLQFTSLDTMLASMQQTQSYLSQQLSALSNNR
ncbi:MAG: flagellar filament capping protein FliD, partial [Limnobacter sp.]|nr:flagellar filament capping protein FliD [Limnobacter sp.]